MILDDMIGTNECFKKGNCLIANITIKHRHLGINLIFTTQNPRSHYVQKLQSERSGKLARWVFFRHF